MKPTRRQISLVLRVGISVVLLALLFKTVDFRDVVDLLREAKPGPLLAAIVLYCVLGTYARAQRWRELVEALGQRLGVSRATELFLVGTLFGQALPTGVGGDVVRALLLARDGIGRARAFNTVLVDRALGLLPLLATGLVALALAPGRATPAVSAMMLVFGAIGLIGMAVLLRAHLWRDRMTGIPLIGWVVTRPGIARFLDAFGDYNTKALLRATAWSMAFIALLVATNMLLGNAIGIESVGILDWAIVVPLASLSLLLPSIGGWGVREWTYVGLLAALDPPVDPHHATAVSILLGVLNLLLAAAGAVLLVAGGRFGLPGVTDITEQAGEARTDGVEAEESSAESDG